MTYPTDEQVEAADVRALLGWVRFLPSPSDADRHKMDRIIFRLAELRNADAAAYVAASKSLGWGHG